MCEFIEYDEFNNVICGKFGGSCYHDEYGEDCDSFKPSDNDFLNGHCDECNGNDYDVDTGICRWDKKTCWLLLPRVPYLKDLHKKNGKRESFDIYIGRRVRFHKEFTKDSKWGNKFYDRLDLYENHVRQHLWNDLDELNGKIMGCWCMNAYPSELPENTQDLRCHGQVLMKLFLEKFPNAVKSWR